MLSKKCVEGERWPANCTREERFVRGLAFL